LERILFISNQGELRSWVRVSLGYCPASPDIGRLAMTRVPRPGCYNNCYCTLLSRRIQVLSDVTKLPDGFPDAVLPNPLPGQARDIPY